MTHTHTHTQINQCDKLTKENEVTEYSIIDYWAMNNEVLNGM